MLANKKANMILNHSSSNEWMNEWIVLTGMVGAPLSMNVTQRERSSEFPLKTHGSWVFSTPAVSTQEKADK